jgi:hypothetical protein
MAPISEKLPSPETLRLEYSEVCKRHEAIKEFRAKLLALLPLASGAGVFLLLSKKGEPIAAAHLGVIGIFGMVITVGLFFHELRGIQHCNDLIRRAKSLEELLKLESGQFSSGSKAYWRGVVGATGAACLIYPATLAAWGYLVGVGFGWWGQA